jgi:hypothetical protein
MRVFIPKDNIEDLPPLIAELEKILASEDGK